MPSNGSGLSLTCPRCGLAVRVRAWYLTLAHCPRCIAWHHVISPMALRDAASPLAIPRMLDVICSEREGGVRITLIGVLDVLSLPALARALRVTERPEISRVVVDLGGVEEIADRAIEMLLVASEQADRCGRDFRVRAGSPRMRQRLARAAGERAFGLLLPSVGEPRVSLGGPDGAAA